MAAASAWIESARPDVVVVDVSVEMLLLARLHGVPVVGVVLPGHRGDDAHLLAHDVADALVACWPPEAHDMARGLPVEARTRLHCVGAVSRLPVSEQAPPGTRHAVVLLGRGGHAPVEPVSDTWTFRSLDGAGGRWVEDPTQAVLDADVVVTHAGQNAIAEVAALRRPAVVVPQTRPHEEQVTTAGVLHDGDWPAVVRDAWPTSKAAWDAVLDEAAALDPRGWAGWCDGGAVDRFADVVVATAARHRGWGPGVGR